MKQYILYIMFALVCSGKDIGFPSRDALEARAKERGSLTEGPKTDGISYQDSDFSEPAKGMMLGADIKRIKHAHDNIASELSQCDCQRVGAVAAEYDMISRLNDKLALVAGSGMNTVLFTMIADLVAFVERDPVADIECEQLQIAESYLTQCGSYIIRALAYHVGDENGVLEEGLLRNAVKLFGNGKLVDETAWDEDDLMPIDSAGLFIVNPGVVVEELKKRPVERVRFFLCGVSDAEEFFRRYGEGGDGLEVLKVKYGANREVIEGKYAEAVAWFAAQGGGE